MADATIHGIEFEIKGSSDAAVKSLERLSAALQKIKSATSSGLGINKVANELKNLNTAIQNTNVAQVATFAAAMKALGRIKISENFAKGITQISKAVKGLKPESSARAIQALGALSTFGEQKIDVPGLESLTQYLNEISKIDFSNLTNAAQALQDISQSTGTINPGASGGGSEATAAAEEQVSAWGRVKDALRGVLRVGSQVVSLPFKKMGKNIQGAASKVGNLFSSLKRVAFYRLIRAAIKMVTDAFKEGIKNAYAWSKEIGGPVAASGMTFAESMDDIATSFKYFKNGIGAAVAPLIGALAPAIRVATDAAVEFLNVINQVIALLTGQSGWMRATRQAEEYEEAVGGAGGAAKEALRYLAPFDELNVLPSQKQGGGGGGADDVGGMFEEMVEFEQGIIDFADRIKKAIEDSDWEGLGTLLGDKVNEILDNIDFAALGTKVGEKINAIFSTEYWTLNTINFQDIGGSIATFLNNAIDSIDFEIIGRDFSKKFTIIFDTVIGFVNEFDFGDLGKSLSDWILGAINELSEWIQKVDWSEFVHNLISGIFDFIANIQIGEILSSIGELAGSIGGAFIEIALAILQDVFTAVTDPDWWALVWAWFKENIIEGFANLGINIANAIITSLQDGLNSFADVWNESGLNQWLYDKFGWDWTIPPIEWTLIPNIDIDAGYEELKEKFDQKTKEDPVAVQAAIDSITENIPESDREFSVTGVLGSLIDQLEDAQKEVFVTAEVESVKAKRVPELPVAAAVSEIVESENIYELRGIVGVVESAEPSEDLVLHPPGLYTRALYKWTDPTPLTREMRTINTWANYAWVKKENLTKDQRTIGTYSNFKWVRTGELTKDQKTINTYSNFKWVRTGELTKDQKTINTYSNFKWVKTGALTLAQKTIDVVGNIASTVGDSLTAAQKTINVIGNYVSTVFASLTNADRTIDATANFKGSQIDPAIQDYWGRIKIGATANIEGVTGQTTITMIPQANGGAFFGNAWHDIPQFASGGRPHGSLFLAGEAGPEIVGHVGGRTEVLNRSQIASSIYTAVRSAMSGLAFRMDCSVGYDDEDAGSEETMYRAFSRALADSDLGGDVELDGDVLYRALVNRNRRNTRMTGVNAMA